VHSTIAAMYLLKLLFTIPPRAFSASKRSFLIQAETGIFECANAMSLSGKRIPRWKSAPSG